MRAWTRRRELRWAGALVISCAALLLSSSCDDDSPCSCPTYQIGAVEGYVLAAGEGCALKVGARALDGPRDGQVIVAALSDSTGWFRLELPTGRYRLETNPISGHRGCKPGHRSSC